MRLAAIRSAVVCVLGGVVLIVGATTVRAQAAQAGEHAPAGRGVDVKLVGGYAGFIDEEMLDHALIGGAVATRVARRVGLELEVLYLVGSGHDRDWVLLPAFTFDLRRSGAVVPYLSAASGWLWHTDRFNGDSYTAQGWTIGGGGGARVALGPRAYLAVEGRIGFEPLARVTAAFGWRLR